jgi:hypothetical protein
MIGKNKKIIIALFVILVLFVVYSFFLRGGGDEDQLLGNSLVADAGVGRDFISLLGELRKLRLDTSLFETPAWNSLIDFSVTIAPEPVGNTNPFQSVKSGGRER